MKGHSTLFPKLMTFGLLSTFVLVASSSADENQNGDGVESKSQSISVTVNSSSTSDGNNKPQSTVTGKVTIMGPDGVRREFNLNDDIEGVMNLQGALANPLEIVMDPAEAAKPRPMIGITTQPVSRLLRKHLKLDINGVVVNAVSENLPAAKAGIQKEDIIIRADGKNITTQQDLSVVVREAGDREFEIELLHEGDRKTVIVKAENVAPQDVPLSFGNLQDGPFHNLMLQGMGPGLQMPDHGNVHQQMQQFMERARQAAREARQRRQQNLPGTTNNLRVEMQKLRKRMAELEQRLEDDKSLPSE